MIIDSSVVDKARADVLSKAAYWESVLGGKKFDEDGRTLLGELSSISKQAVENEVLKHVVSNGWKLAFKKYAIKKGIAKVGNKTIENIMGSYRFLTPKPYMVNEVKIEYENGKKLKMKLSRFLAGIQAEWMAGIPQYKEISDKLKELRTEKKGYEDREVSRLTNLKKRFERDSIFFLYDNLLNSYSNNKVYLSINPLDKLTSSGGAETLCNPTKFWTCWSTRFYIYPNRVEVMRDGCFSNPEAQVEIGKSKLSGMIYVPNGNSLRIPGTDFFLLGYAERGHLWLDGNRILIEKLYPTNCASRKAEFNTLFKKLGLVPVPNWTNEMVMKKFTNPVEKEIVENYINLSKNNKLFFDRVAVVDGEFVMLKKHRMSYNSHNSDQMPLLGMHIEN